MYVLHPGRPKVCEHPGEAPFRRRRGDVPSSGRLDRIEHIIIISLVKMNAEISTEAPEKLSNESIIEQLSDLRELLKSKVDTAELEKRLTTKADAVDVQAIAKTLAEQKDVTREQSKLLLRAFLPFLSCLIRFTAVALCSLCSGVLQGAALILSTIAFPIASKAIGVVGCLGSMAAPMRCGICMTRTC